MGDGSVVHRDGTRPRSLDFFIIQYASVLGAENTGVETGTFGLSFGVLVFLSIGTFVIYYNLRNPFYENRSDESVDMDEWPGKEDDEW